MQTAKPLAIELKGIRKSFGPVQANQDVCFSVERGTIHGLIGENGAGKSTVAKIIYGMIRPDSGEVFIHGEKKEWRSSADAIAAGLGMVHQHFMLADPISALDNIILGREPTRFAKGLGPFAPIDRKGARSKLEKLSKKAGLILPWEKPVEELSVGVQQRVEIVKLLDRDADVLILDEPTAVLTPQETEELFARLRELKAQGKTILIITHKLKEVMDITDSVTVFRHGRVAAHYKTAETSIKELASAMVGRPFQSELESQRQGVSISEPILRLEKLSFRKKGETRDSLSEISLELRPGEIVGVAGVEGNGQCELLDCIFQPKKMAAQGKLKGEYIFSGEDARGLGAADVRKRRLGFIAQDRHREALLMNSTVERNFLLGHEKSPRYQSAFLIRLKALRERIGSWVQQFDIRPGNPSLMIRGLSGGNQQKVVVARELDANPKVILAAQPTRGVDIGAIEKIHTALMSARNRGAAILLVSSELDEIQALSDRICILYEGRIVSQGARGQLTEKEIGSFMGGVQGK